MLKNHIFTLENVFWTKHNWQLQVIFIISEERFKISFYIFIHFLSLILSVEWMKLQFVNYFDTRAAQISQALSQCLKRIKWNIFYCNPYLHDKTNQATYFIWCFTKPIFMEIKQKYAFPISVSCFYVFWRKKTVVWWFTNILMDCKSVDRQVLSLTIYYRKTLFSLFRNLE
jgi:hypothetical protein